MDTPKSPFLQFHTMVKFLAQKILWNLKITCVINLYVKSYLYLEYNITPESHIKVTRIKVILIN